MKTFLGLCTLLALRLAAADVSHLNAKYLPPAMHNNGLIHGYEHNTQSQQKTTTSIEKQFLRELPEQIEYGQSAQYGSFSIPMTNNMLMTMMHNNAGVIQPMSAVTMPTSSMEIQRNPSNLHNMPTMHYLPPKMQHAAAPLQQHSMQPMLQTQYLPPTFMPASQYQQKMQQAPYIHTSMPTIASPEMGEIERQNMMEYTQAEPQPAHMLTTKGYQYKTGNAFPTPRFGSTSNMRRFRLKQ